MAKVVYSMGAGANFGKWSDKGEILEGLPVVDEIPQELSRIIIISISKVIVA